MNIIEFACFIGLPWIVAFVLLVGVQDAFPRSLAIGAGSAFVSLFAVILFSYIYRLLRRRRLEKAHVAIWAVLAVILSASVGLYFRFHYSPNHSIQRTGASRLAQFVFVAQQRLAPAADADR